MTGQPDEPEEAPEADPVAKAPAPTDAELDRERVRIEIEKDRTSLRRHRDDLGLRRRVANGALLVMIVQIAVADAGFYLYGDSNDWHIPAGAIQVWLAATVVQVVSVVLVITRYLFPGGGSDDSSASVGNDDAGGCPSLSQLTG